jgi:hypothetical protein
LTAHGRAWGINDRFGAVGTTQMVYRVVTSDSASEAAKGDVVIIG